MVEPDVLSHPLVFPCVPVWVRIGMKKKKVSEVFLSIYKNSKRIDSGVRTLSPTIRSKELVALKGPESWRD